MRAAQIRDYGDSTVLQTVTDAPKPTINPDQVLVEVRAAAVNPFDIKLRKGLMKDSIPLKFPAILGGDFAGVITEVGSEVKDLKIGDEVYGQADATSSQGSYAEFTPAKATSTALKPKTVDFETAAALPLTGVSSIQALIEHANLQAGQKVLIHGGAGGIGSYAIQLAKHLGAYVATTAVKKDHDFVKSLGANEVIDYEKEDFSEILEDYDVVYDTVGGDTTTKSCLILKPNGTLVSMVSKPDEELIKKHQVNFIAQVTKTTPERLTKLAELVDQGAIKAKIDKVYPLEEAAEAHAYLESGKHNGKIVLKI